MKVGSSIWFGIFLNSFVEPLEIPLRNHRDPLNEPFEEPYETCQADLDSKVFDFIVVGAGSAGCPCAARLARPC